MRTMWRKGLLALAMVASPWAGAGAQTPATKELSERSVSVLMDYAWVILPTKFTAPDGKVIEVDKIVIRQHEIRPRVTCSCRSDDLSFFFCTRHDVANLLFAIWLAKQCRVRANRPIPILEVMTRTAIVHKCTPLGSRPAVAVQK